MLGVTDIVNNCDKENWVHSGYGIAFDGKDTWSFVYDYAKNIIAFGVDNSSSSHADDCKNNCSVKETLLILMEALSR